MRKILFVLVIILLLIFTGIIMYKGTKVGNFEIWGITDISEKNKEIDEKNAELGYLVSVTYPEQVTNLNTSAETLQETKKEYENQAVLLSNSKYFKQTEKYKLEFLWTRIGNYAKDNKVVIKIDVTNSTTKELYDLNFTVTGRYANIAQFIYNIENDSRLGFKIEDFSMKAAYTTKENTNFVEGKFTCKEIRIDLKNIDSSNTVQKNETTNTNNTTSTNTTNTSGNATNTTNTTNTTSSQNTDNTVNNTTTETNTTTNSAG